MKITAYVSTLMRLAYELGAARKNGDPEQIAAAQQRHDAYQRACLAADELVLDIPDAHT